MLPNRYWKTGSFSNGDAWRRLGSSDEMFVTASTVRAATSVKSGPLGSGRGVAVAGCAVLLARVAVAAGGCASEGPPDRRRPVGANPATNPTPTSSRL